MTLIVDPPSGWMYGFPAPLEEDYEQQLRKAGYPESDIPMALKHSRYLADTREELIERLNKEKEQYEIQKQLEPYVPKQVLGRHL